MALIEDFKKFAFKGNVVDLAVGVIIGGAFGKIVSSLVADLVMPFVSLVLPGGSWRTSVLVLREMPDPKDSISLKYGDFLGAVLDFFVVAAALFLIVSWLVKAAEARLAAPPPPAAEPDTRACPYCFETVSKQATRCKACTSELARAS